MGQRSQIYIRATKTDGEKVLLARYYQWNYAERMISRARWTIEFLKDHTDDFYWKDPSFVTKLARYVDVNFDMHDIVMSSDIIKEYEEWGEGESFANFVFLEQDNNDGKLLIDVDIKAKAIKYAFLDCDISLDNIMDGNVYMRWENRYANAEDGYSKNWRSIFASCWDDTLKASEIEEMIKTCEDNINAISKNAVLMTCGEIENFINYDYTVHTREDAVKSSEESGKTYEVETVINPDEAAIYERCLTTEPQSDNNENGTLVPIAEDSVGFKNEMDAERRAEKYFADIIKSARKPERGRVQTARQLKQDVER